MNSHTADLLDLRLVEALQFDGRAPFSRIAEVLGVSDQTIARRYRRLRSTGLLRIVGAPGADRGRWIIRLQCVPSAVQALAEALARRPDIVWVQLVSGGTEILCNIGPVTAEDGEQILLEALPRSDRIISVAAHRILYTFCGSPRRVRMLDVLTPEEERLLEPPDPVPGWDADVPPLEPGDIPLLEVLSRDGRAGHAELSAATGWSPSTVARRVDHLRATGSLLCYAEFDLRYAGLGAAARLWITVPPGELDGVGRALAAHPETAFVAATTGPANLNVAIVCRDSRAIYRYLTERVAALPVIGHVETTPIGRNVKGVGAVLPHDPSRRPR
ncbi:Lrp/AsnC family transcriptional regulator [Actinomadura roseirufa]|uniref:Lrp/AsnC family transcriptional regulator n=1 Tax=Actinomadura roseirufa TaxID=2094049 RepID=UPI0010418275|nr:Lrp/AsnC family transcriptional regulator [Actinomadura roseirufa]